jgi:hypothetical protein
MPGERLSRNGDPPGTLIRPTLPDETSERALSDPLADAWEG